MPSCTLEIGSRIVTRAEGGPFDAEYALFEAHEIELRSNNEPGTVREHGYRTTAELARERLEMEGVTRALAETVAGELGALATAYARGPEVRRVVALLTPAELFEGRTWQAASKTYEGGWLDVAALAGDLGIDGASRALQQLYLTTLLADAQAEANVYLSTTDYTGGRRPGERTYRRVSLATVGLLPDAVRALADRPPSRPLRDGGPSRAELLESVRARLAAGVLESSRTALESIERALSIRDRPQRGPLSDPDLWALELQLADANTEAVMEKIDALERSRGRQPATAYLRARATFVLGSEDPAQLAERVSSLAMSMNSFAELELLSAEAWARAGDRKRALAYAHDLAENPQVDPALRARARAIVQPTRASVPAMPRPPSTVPPFTPPAPQSEPPPRSESAPMISITAGMRASVVPAAAQASPPEDYAIAPTPILSVGIEALRRSSAPPSDSEVPPVPPTPVSPVSRLSASAIRAEPRVSQSALRVEAPRTSQSSMKAPTVPPTRSSTRPWMSPPAGFFADAPPPTSVSVPPPLESRPSAAPPTVIEDAPAGSDDDDGGDEVVVRGGSQPPFRTEPPPPNFPSSPLVPRLEPERVEKVEALSLPGDLETDLATDDLPTTPVEARIYFTRQARELGRLYRQRYNVELRTDLRSVEVVQRYLSERFETGDLKTEDDVAEVRRHGAFLSELLARRLGAEWTDLAVSEMGYWGMNIPPGTTIWPVGRVIRFVTMRHRERDLVSYFLELQARMHGLK